MHSPRFSRMASILAIFFVINVIAVFQGYWWKDTYSSIYWSLAIIGLINCLIPNRRLLYRIPIDLLIGVAITFRVTWHRQPEVVEHTLHRFASLHPFVEITMAIIAILILLEWFASKKSRLMILFGSGLLILTITDSFSPLKLWGNVGWLIIIFLLWHTVIHFRSFDEDTKKKLMRRPFALFTPVAAVLASIMLVGVSLPHGPPLLEDPYALWIKSKGEKVPAFLGDKGYSSPNPSSLLSSSGYSRDSSVLGGGFNYDYSPIMEVTTSHKGYLKGETKAVYDGEGWSHSELLGRQGPIRINEPIEPYHGEPLATYTDVVQTVTMIKRESLSVLFSNGIPVQLSEFQYDASNQGSEQGIQMLPQYSRLDMFMWNPVISTIATENENSSFPVYQYVLQSNPLIIDQQGLKEAEAAFDPSYKPSINAEVYLEVPDIVPQRVYDLASTVTEAATNDYERALLLEQHLRMNYAYTNLPDGSKLTGQSQDFVDQFLFELYEGYCDYFSTAMVILARTLDMPARWVKGFTAGVNEMDQYMNALPEYMLEQTPEDTGGTFTVRNADAHSWVEIYFKGYGWVAFEPTPGFSIPQQYSSPEIENLLSELLPETELDTEATVPQEEGWGLSEEARRVILWVSVSLLLLAIVGTLLIYRKSLWISWRNLRDYSYNNNEKIVIEVNRLLRGGRKIGLPVHATATMRETLFQWKQHYPSVEQELNFLLYQFENAQYSPKQMSEQDVERVRENVSSIKKHWKNKK